jgi:hypothetical protein
MRTSEQIDQIVTALAAAQGEIKNPPKNKINPHFKSKYADLADGLEAVRPILSKQGIAVIQAPQYADGIVALITRLAHKSGQWIECDYPVGALTTHQKLGADLTYAKRQSLFSIVGVCGDDDLDGEDSARAEPPAIRRESPPRPKPVSNDDMPFSDFPGDRPAPNVMTGRATAPREYINVLYGVIANHRGDSAALKDWWMNEKGIMTSNGVDPNSDEFRDLYNAFVAKGRSLAALEKERAAA